MQIYEYGNREIEYLKRRDPILGQAIDRIGMIEREVNPDPFASLISSIVSQQISSKAAETVWNRLCEIVGDVTPDKVGKIKLSELQSCGISFRKAGYIKEAAVAAIQKRVDFDTLHSLSDDEVVTELTKLKGVGAWTAEMMLIFTLKRPDIVSFKDLGIRRGMMRLYDLDELTVDTFEKYRKTYSPYGTVASLYLWQISAEN